MRCVIYLRVSTKEQAEKDLTEEGFSIAAQREACVRRIRDEGWELVDEYVDKGESARTADRSRLQAMLARIAEDGDVEAVVVHKVDRLARNMEDHIAIRALLRRRGARLGHREPRRHRLGAKPVTVSGMAQLLAHRAYAGVVEWDGVEYEGQHEPLVQRATFDKVQEVLAVRAMRGTRERRHHHYLKGLSIQYSKGTYTYFYCLGQKDRRNRTGCRERYVAAAQLEVEVENLYGRIEVPAAWADGLRRAIAQAEAALRSPLFCAAVRIRRCGGR